MKIHLSPGDVLRDSLANFRPSSDVTITFLTEWDWGHTCQIDYTVIDHYEAGQTLKFNKLPHLNIANASLNSDMEIEIRRQ